MGNRNIADAVRLQYSGKGNRDVFRKGQCGRSINGSLTLKASTMANDVFHELSVARVVLGNVFGNNARLSPSNEKS